MPLATCALTSWRRLLGRQLVVQVLAAGLVLDERERVGQLADVVVVGRDAGQERIGADRLGGALGEVADHQRVVVRARRLEQQPAQQRLRRVGQLEQLERGGDAEEVAEDRERADSGQRHCRPRTRAPAPASWSRPVTSPSPSSVKADTTMTLTTPIAMAAWTNWLRRSPRRTTMRPARPPRKT